MITPLALTLDGQPFAVRRIFCVGRNYAEHAAEMGNAVDREAPFYFTKSAHALIPPGPVPYPPATHDLHHEVELVLALTHPLFRADADQARAAVAGRAVGLDMTRRDLQAAAKDKRRPWDTGKDFDASAVIAPLSSVPAGPRIRLHVNDVLRQDARLDQMIFDETAILMHLSTLYRLQPGDLVMTGTPAGVGPVVRGDRIDAGIDNLPPLQAVIV